MNFKWKNQPFKWKNKNKCPLCGAKVFLKKQKPKEGCIKIRYLICTNCDFDTRKINENS